MMSPTRGLWNFVWSLQGKGDGALAAIEAYSHVACLRARSRRRRRRAALGAAPPRAVVPRLRLGAVADRRGRPTWRCRASCSRPTWRISGCRFARLHAHRLHRRRFSRPCCALGFAAALVLIVAHTRRRSRDTSWAPLSAERRIVSPLGDIAHRGAKVPSPMPIRTAATACAITAWCTPIASPSSSARRW